MPSDEPARRLDPRDEAEVGSKGIEVHGSWMAPERPGSTLLDDEPATRRPEGGLVEEDLARAREALDPRRDDDGRPGQRDLARPRHAPRPGDDLAGRDPDPDGERLVPGDLRIGERGPDGQRAQRRAEGVVIVCPGMAEDGEDRVADELLAGPAELDDGGVHRGQRGIHAQLDLLRVVFGKHADVVDEVGEEGGDDAAVA